MVVAVTTKRKRQYDVLWFVWWEYDIEVGGSVRFFEIKELMHIPHLKRCNHAVPVCGSALYVSD